MPRTVIANSIPGRWCVWGLDSGGPVYDFGTKAMTATEHVHAIWMPDGKRSGSHRVYDDVIAVELDGGAAAPPSIAVEIMDRAEWFALQREARDAMA